MAKRDRCNGTVKKDFAVNCLKFLRKRSKGGNRTYFCYLLSSQLKLFQIWQKQEPINWSEQPLCAHVTAFSPISLFLEWFWRESRICFKSHKPVSRTSEKGVFHILITLGLVFLFHILHFECTDRRKEASFFAGKSALKLIYLKINRRVKTP